MGCLHLSSKRVPRFGVLMFSLSLALASCADVDGQADDLAEYDALAQEATAAEHADLGVSPNGRDVVTIGDSWMSNTLGTGDAIEGALRRAGKRYRNFGVQGVMLLSASLFGAAIPTQFETAVRQGRDIKTVVMTAGGNDVIQNAGVQADCRANGPTCQKKLADIGAGLTKLWTRMAQAGVQDVIYIGYASNAGSAGAGAANANSNGMGKLCAAAPLRCHLIDSTPLVGPTGLSLDGIHPTRATNDRIARAILQLMEQKGLRR